VISKLTFSCVIYHILTNQQFLTFFWSTY